MSINGQTFTWRNVNVQGMGYVTGLVVHPDTTRAPIHVVVVPLGKSDDERANAVKAAEQLKGKVLVGQMAHVFQELVRQDRDIGRF